MIEAADTFAIAGEISSKELNRPDFGAVPSTKPRFYVSYAWSDHTPGGEDREKIVDQLCAAAEVRGTPIRRDKKVLGFGDSITKFMKETGQGDRVFVFLSDKYLKSPYCMFELFEVWRNSKHDEQEFLQRCRLYTIGNAKIWIPDRLLYAEHWKQQHDQIKTVIDRVGLCALGDQDYARFKLMQDFVNHIGDVLAAVADIVQPYTFDDLVNYGFEDPPEPETEA
jgi:internalin A